MRAKRVRKLRKTLQAHPHNSPEINYEPGTKWVSPSYLIRKVKKTYNRIKNELNPNKSAG